jgi:mRNA interferase RelE/StbE
MYQLVFLPIAKKELAKLDFAIQKRIKEKLLLLCANPQALKNNIKSLKGEHEGKFRLRVNQYRIIFSTEEDKLIITIIRIRHRKEVY